ncbi:hypothetical protein VP01_15096g1, partial [Puccinia sorghi]
TFTGILNYLSCRTRPDLAPAVSILPSFNNETGIEHWKKVIHCWKYADDLETHLSRSGSIFFWKSCPVAWNSKKQRNITLSSTEAEMNALSDGVQENQWIKYLVDELWN